MTPDLFAGAGFFYSEHGQGVTAHHSLTDNQVSTGSTACPRATGELGGGGGTRMRRWHPCPPLQIAGVEVVQVMVLVTGVTLGMRVTLADRARDIVYMRCV